MPDRQSLCLRADDAEALTEFNRRIGALAGAEIRLTFECDGSALTIEGRVARRREWRSPEDPHLLLRPGTTDRVHVLAEMAVSLRRRGAGWYLARRRWYEEQDLDETPLGSGDLEVELTPLP